jgi:periplasmic copper chaperone A
MMRALPTVLAALLLASGAGAHELKAGSITIEHPWARPAASGNSAAYFTLENGGADDRLIGVSSDIAASVEMHSTTIDAQGVGRMVPVQAVDIPAGAQATFAPGGLHVMLIGLIRPLESGQEFPLTLTFEQAGAITVEVAVEKAPSHGGGETKKHKHGTTSP